VEISQRVLSLCAGYDELDPFSRKTIQLAPLGDELILGTPEEGQLEFFFDQEAAEIFARAKALLKTLVKRVHPIDYQPFHAAAQLLYSGPWVAERYAAVGAFLENESPDHDPTVRRIILAGKKPSAVDAFRGGYELASLRMSCERQWKKMDVLVLPTTPTTYTPEQVANDPVGTNTRLGTYTNFVNLLDLCAIAVPAGARSDGAALGITLLAPAFHEQTLTRLAGRYCATLTAD
jgi:allophanate hydrolase